MKSVHRITGWSLTELLCVVIIISILAAIYLGVIGKAFVHVKKFLGGL
jgi:prepilin-type N-terminal cleavage/methylation domain-containing protein